VKRRVHERDFRTYLWTLDTVSKGIISKLIDKLIYFFHYLLVNCQFGSTLFCHVVQVFFPTGGWSVELLDIGIGLGFGENGSNIHLERNIYLTTQKYKITISHPILFYPTHLIYNPQSYSPFYLPFTTPKLLTSFLMNINLKAENLSLEKLVES
jgi:hypothetical protein